MDQIEIEKIETRYDASLADDGYPPKSSGGRTYKGKMLWKGAEPQRVEPIKKGPTSAYDW